MLDGLFNTIAHAVTGGANHLPIHDWESMPVGKKIEYLSTTDQKYFPTLIEYCSNDAEKAVLAAAMKLPGIVK